MVREIVVNWPRSPLGRRSARGVQGFARMERPGCPHTWRTRGRFTGLFSKPRLPIFKAPWLVGVLPVDFPPLQMRAAAGLESNQQAVRIRGNTMKRYLSIRT